jgi:hypothetical protein
MSEGFSLQEALWGESCSYISFSSISRQSGSSLGVMTGAIFLFWGLCCHGGVNWHGLPSFRCQAYGIEWDID